MMFGLDSDYSPPKVDRIWLWVDYDKIPRYPRFYLLKSDYKPQQHQEFVRFPNNSWDNVRVKGLGFGA